MGNAVNKLLQFPSNIDLVTAAQIEYDYLRSIDNNSTLYDTPTLKNALYRYEIYWLPLVSEYEIDTLLPPIDISWIWHCHILNPIAYRNDCIKLVGKVVNHKPRFLSETKNSKTCKELWETKYPNVPFDVDLNIVSPPLLMSDYTQQSSYDVISAAQRQRVFNYNSSLSHFRDPKFLKKAVKRYKIMLSLKRDNPSIFIVPCYDNDLIWHTHQLHPLQYEEDTKYLLGKMLDHDDSTNDRSPNSDLEVHSKATRELWSSKGYKFGIPGAMYRGEPPIPITNYDRSSYKDLANRDITITSRNLKLDLANLIPISKIKSFKDIKILFIKETSSQKHKSQSKTQFTKSDPEIDNFAISYDFNKGEGKISLQTNDHKYLKMVCEIKTQSKSTETKSKAETHAFVDLIHINKFISSSKSDKPLTFQLFCKTRPEKISGSFSFLYSEVVKEYSFHLQTVTRLFNNVSHIKDVLHHVKLMALDSIYQESSPCEYSDHTLVTDLKTTAFTWRVVHSQNPILSAIELLDKKGNVVSTSHSISSSTVPNKKQVADTSKTCTHNAKTQKSFLIRGPDRDYAILKAKWFGFRKGTKQNRAHLGTIHLDLFICEGKVSKWISVKETKPRIYEWKIDTDLYGKVDLEKGNIILSTNTIDIPENVCIGSTMALAFVLCHPRPPPGKDGLIDDVIRYPPPPANRPSVLPIDDMFFLIASGLYSSVLPRWYHTRLHNGFMIQNHPNANKESNDCESWHTCPDSGFNGATGDGGFDSGGGDWGSGVDSAGCGGCGGGCGGGGDGGGCGGGGGGGDGGGGGGGCGGGGGGGG